MIKKYRYVIWSGSSSAPGDIIPDGSTLEVKLVNQIDLDNVSYEQTKDGYFILATFGDNKGRVDNLNEDELDLLIKTVRISIKGPSEKWILISDLEFS